MLTRWLTKLDPVHVARTPEEREAVYRFRYLVYHEEFGREVGKPDHERKVMTDEEDEEDYTTVLYTGTPELVTGTARLMHWPPGGVPDHHLHDLSMDVFPDLVQRHTAEIGRYVIRKGMRGKLLLAAIMAHGYHLLAGEQGTELAFCHCSPGLVHYYRKLGCRPFAGRAVHCEDGVLIPLVNVLSDLDYYRRMGCPATALVRRHFGRGKRDPLDIEPYRHLFESDQSPVEVDDEKVWDELQEAFSGEAEQASALDSLPETVVRHLTQKGFILRVTADTLMTRQGFGEEELYLILDGLFEALQGERRLRVMGKGELFGELSFFLPGHRRTVSVRAVTDGRLLVLRGSSLRKLMDSDPKTAARILYDIGGSMAARLASSVPAEPDVPS